MLPLSSVIVHKWRPRPGYRSKFGPETVNVLFRMVRRWYQKPFRAICVTDDAVGIDKSIEIVSLGTEFADVVSPHGVNQPSCYRRLRLFSPQARDLFGDRFVALDLDTVVTGDLSPLWDNNNDFMMWGDTNPTTHYNGSMMMMTAGARVKVWNDFDPLRSPTIAKRAGQFGSDQAWISYCLGPNEKKWTIKDGVYSYRLDIKWKHQGNLPKDAKIVFFHGNVDPWSPMAWRHPWVRQNWR